MHADESILEPPRPEIETGHPAVERIDAAGNERPCGGHGIG